MIARTKSRKLKIEFGLLRRVGGGAGNICEIRGIRGVQGEGLFRINDFANSAGFVFWLRASRSEIRSFFC